MPDLLQLLQSQDAGHQRIVAELWGLELRPQDADSAAEEVAAAMLDPELMTEVIESLDAAARAALTTLARAGGRIPWPKFIREFGDVREMGAGRRDREQPHLHPASPAEVLFYRALLGRAFFEMEQGPQEFAYIPEDVLHLIQKRGPEPLTAAAPGHPARAAERSHVAAANDGILDDATTLLAALRGAHPASEDPVRTGLLECAGIMQHGAPQAGRVKVFLEMPRGEALHMLADAWRASTTFNELRLVPGLICEGTWVNDPRATREFLLSQMEAIPRGTWWSLGAFIGGIKQQHADFQRPAGDYESWFIKNAADGHYLRGFSSWDQVDGALIRFLISGVMHRLGMLDVASTADEKEPSAFRWAEAQASRTTENGKLHVGSQGRISVPHRVPRAARYQLSRFCKWDDEKSDEYRYHITPGSLTKAREQGLKAEHLLALLAKHADAGIPPVLVKALKRWEANGTEARAESQVVLKVSKPEILKELRKSKAAKYLGEPLGPTTVIVKGGAIQKVAEAMTELGLLLEDRTDLST